MAIKPTDVYGSLSKTIEDTLKGAGAIKGAPCTIKSIAPIEGGNRVTFSWKDTSNVEHTQTMDVMNGEKGDKGAKGDKGDNAVLPSFKTINGQSIVGNGNIVIEGGSGEGGTTVVANPVLSGNEELATSIQIGTEKYVFPQTNTNGLTSAQITMLESVLYSVAFTDASGKSKVDALIASLRSGVVTPSEPTEPDDDNPDTPSTEEPDDGGDTPTVVPLTWTHTKISSNGSASADENNRATDFAEVDATKTYTIRATQTDGAYNPNVTIYYYNSSKGFISRVSSVVRGTTTPQSVLELPEGCAYFRLNIASANDAYTEMVEVSYK